MIKKRTDELNDILGKTHPNDFDRFYKENKDSLTDTSTAFCTYVKKIIKKNGLTQQDTFLAADIPERYGYKLLSGEKHTRQRDVILRICYGAEMTPDHAMVFKSSL